eukprot:3915094-Rhodomonas_salina.2
MSNNCTAGATVGRVRCDCTRPRQTTLYLATFQATAAVPVYADGDWRYYDNRQYRLCTIKGFVHARAGSTTPPYCYEARQAGVAFPRTLGENGRDARRHARNEA